MKVKISKDYGMWESMLKSDLRRLRDYKSVTTPCEYHKWETVDVDFDGLKKLIEEGTAIMINC